MSHSAQEQSYDGIFVYKRGEEMGSVRIIHVVKDGKERERVIHLDGPPREIVLREHDIGCVHSSARMLRRLKPANAARHPYNDDPSSKLTRHYAFKLAGSGRVAGRPVTKLHIDPRDERRLGYRLYLDKSSALLLKSATVDRDRRILESFQFTRIIIGDAVNEADLQPESKAAAFHDYHSLSTPHVQSTSEVESAWHLGWMPDGFVMAADAQRKFGDAHMNSMHYTDGLAMFSVFVEPAKAMTPVFEQRQGSTAVYSESQRDGSHWHTITVVGEVPPSTAREIAKGVRPNETLAQ